MAGISPRLTSVAVGGAAVLAVAGSVGAVNRADPAMPALVLAATSLTVCALGQRRRSLPVPAVLAILLIAVAALGWYAWRANDDRALLRVAMAALTGLKVRVVVDAHIDTYLVALASAVLGWTGWIAVVCGVLPALAVGSHSRDQAGPPDERTDKRAGAANVVLAGTTTLVLLVLAYIER